MADHPLTPREGGGAHDGPLVAAESTSSVRSSSASSGSSRPRPRSRRQPDDSGAPTTTTTTQPRGGDRASASSPSQSSRQRRLAAARPPRSQLTLCCDGVTVQRRRGLVIDCVSALVYGGCVTAVVNCCGSHSAFYLLNALAGQEEADNGIILMNGTPVTAAAYQRRCVLIDEDFAAFEELTVRENLGYAAAMRVAGSTRAYTVDDIVRQLLLTSVQDAVVRDCSLYVRRRLSLGKELLRNPLVIILDQPLEGLATHEAQQFLSILRKIAAPAAADAAEEAAEVSRTRPLQRRPSQSQSPAPPSHSERVTVGGPATSDAAPLGLSASSRSMGGSGTGSVPSLTPSTPPAMRASLYTPRPSGRARGTGDTSTPTPTPATSTGGAGGGGEGEVTAGALHTRSLPLPVAAAAEPVTTERIVILSMTQPRWAMLRYVDDVLLLEGGSCAYSGPLEELLTARLPALPPLRRAASTAAGGGRAGAAGSVAGASSAGEGGAAALAETAGPPAQRPRHETFVYDMYRLASTGDGSLSRALGPNAAAAMGGPTAVAASPTGTIEVRMGVGGNVTQVRAAIDRHLQQCATGALTLTGWQYSSPGGVVQLFYLFKYSALQIRNNIIVDVSLFFILIGVAVLLAAVYDSQAGQSGMQNRVGIIFFLVSTTFLQSIIAVESIRRDYLSFQRHRAHGYYPAWVFLTYRVTTCAVMRFAVASVFALAVFLTSNFGLPWTSYAPIFELAVIIAVTSLVSYFTVFFTCTFMSSLRVAALVLFTIYTVNVVLAGLVLNLTTLPRAIQILSLATVVRLSYESCILTQFWHQSFDCDEDAILRGTSRDVAHPLRAAWSPGLASGPARGGPPSSPALAAAMVGGREGLARVAANRVTCYTGRQYAQFLGFREERRWVNVGAMAGMAAGFVVLSFVMMLLYRPRRYAKGGL